MPGYRAEPPEITWSKGQPFSERFEDHYWAKGNPLAEKAFVFPAQHDLDHRVQSTQHFTLAEIGFGFGHNFLLTAEQFLSVSTDATLHYFAFERFPPPARTLADYWATRQIPLTRELIDRYPNSIKGWFPVWLHPRIRLIFIFDDINHALPELEAQVDAWYLDGFKPATNPEVFNAFVYHQMSLRSKPGATLSSFSVAASLRHGLTAAGFDVMKRPGFGTKRELLFAQKPGHWAPTPKLTPQPLIIGNGLAGTAISQALTRYSIPHQLLTSHQAKGASNQPAFNVYPQLSLVPDDRALFSLAAHHFTRLHSLEFEPAPMHWLSADPARQTRMARLAQHLPDDLLCDQQGQLRFPTAGILRWTPADAAECDIRQIRESDTHWLVRSKDQHELTTDTLILATGAETTQFLPWSMKHIRGQSMEFRTSTQLPRLYSGDFGLTHLGKDLYLIGSTYTLDDQSIEPRDEDAYALSAKLNAHFPGIKIIPTAQHTGIRVAYPDRVPGFGESFTHRFTQPSWQRIDQTRSFVHEEPESNWIFQTPTKSNEALQGPRCFASTGFGSHGATHAALAGESIAEHLAGAPRSLPRSMRQRFRPDRFDPRRPMKN